LQNAKLLFSLLFLGGHFMSAGYGSGRALARAGLLNGDAHEYGELAAGKDNDLRGTWCTSQHCAGASTSGLQIIHVGGAYKSKCPNCGGDNLFFDRVSPTRAPKLKEKAQRFLALEHERKKLK
jgi:hypothetical protein